MGIDALTRTDAGDDVSPANTADWQSWVSATATRNCTLGDHLLDWLSLYGESQGFIRDDAVPGYDPRTDFTLFIFEQGRRFEAAVLDYLHNVTEVTTVATERGDARNLEAAQRTFQFMQEGKSVIYQGVLWDAEHRTYGVPDFLVRSDFLQQLFPECLSDADLRREAPDLGLKGLHYRIVDSKFTTLHFSSKGDLANDGGSTPAYKVQLFLYNRALGRLQGFEPDAAYLLGRGWEQTTKGVTERGFSCLERLGGVGPMSTLARKRPVSDAVEEACRWVRDVRLNGSSWTVTPTPSKAEMYPNSTNPQDGPWHIAKRRIAEELDDLTLLWQVGLTGRNLGHGAGIYRWRDERCSPAVVGVTGDSQPLVLQALMDINRSTDGPALRPEHISAAQDEWRRPPALEFYVDFETVSDLADDFSQMPRRGGQTLIYMIGCGHLENSEWSFQSFLAQDLSEDSEASIIEAWIAHMDSVRSRLLPDGDHPLVIHWSPAEVSNFESAYNSAKERHPEKNWPSPRWFDFLNRVIKAEPVVVRGAMGFGLKAVARAMHQHGFIETLWGDGPADGLGAMVGAWWCQDQARSTGAALADLDLMQEIVRYNEVDCRVMMEAVRYLRLHH